MMQDGLHIGLAAWINAQRNTGSFAVYPASPIATASWSILRPLRTSTIWPRQQSLHGW